MIAWAWNEFINLDPTHDPEWLPQYLQTHAIHRSSCVCVERVRMLRQQTPSCSCPEKTFCWCPPRTHAHALCVYTQH